MAGGGLTGGGFEGGLLVAAGLVGAGEFEVAELPFVCGCAVLVMINSVLPGVCVEVVVAASGVSVGVTVWDGVRVGVAVAVVVGVSVIAPGAVKGRKDARVAVGDGVSLSRKIGR